MSAVVVHGAQKLNRQWIGIDITHLAISLIEKRLKHAFPTGLELQESQAGKQRAAEVFDLATIHPADFGNDAEAPQ